MPPAGFALAVVTERSRLAWSPEEPTEISWRRCFAGWPPAAQGRAFAAITTGSNRGLGAVVAISGLTQQRRTVVDIEVGPGVVASPGQGC